MFDHLNYVQRTRHVVRFLFIVGGIWIIKIVKKIVPVSPHDALQLREVILLICCQAMEGCCDVGIADFLKVPVFVSELKLQNFGPGW